MGRLLLAALVAVGVPNLASAQPLTPLTTASGVGGFGGGARANSPPLVPTTLPGKFHHGQGLRGGFVKPGHVGPGYPFSGVWGGFGGWFPTYGWGYGYQYGYPYVVPVEVPVPVPVVVGPPTPPERVVELSNEFPAVLVLEFPAPAEVWVDGKKGEGEPTNEWTLTSPVLAAGGSYEFKVKARWEVGGKKFGYERTVTVKGGQRSRALVVAGTPIKD